MLKNMYTKQGKTQAKRWIFVTLIKAKKDFSKNTPN